VSTTDFDRLAALLGPRAERRGALGARTTYRVGGPAAVWFEAGDLADLDRVAEALAAEPAPCLVVGRGSNLLVADRGFAGLAVGLGPGFEELALEPGAPRGAQVRAGGAVPLPVLARRTAAAGLRGLEWAVGVPGSVGGAVRMNAGGHGSDVAAGLRSVAVRDLAEPAGGVGQRPVTALDLGYRRSALGPTEVVVAATFALVAGDRAEAEAEIAAVVRWRVEHQPGGPNAGSAFTNPPATSAGALIERAGLKGLRLGSARVSPKHANFIAADGGGSADDVARLMALVAERVEHECGIRLAAEVRMVGFEAGAGPARR